MARTSTSRNLEDLLHHRCARSGTLHAGRELHGPGRRRRSAASHSGRAWSAMPTQLTLWPSTTIGLSSYAHARSGDSDAPDLPSRYVSRDSVSVIPLVRRWSTSVNRLLTRAQSASKSEIATKAAPVARCNPAAQGSKACSGPHPSRPQRSRIAERRSSAALASDRSDPTRLTVK
jgi:hypothetical protein